MRALPLLTLSIACAGGTPDEVSDDTGALADDTASPATDTGTPPAPVFAALDDAGEVVVDVDLGRYVGTWYEIGTYLIPFQAACTGSTAQYAPLDDDTITVRNRCLIDDLDGDPFVVAGTADIVNATNTKLSVKFFGDVGAPYWVIERDGRDGDTPYDWAVVSGPGNASLWILHRAPQMPDTLRDPILDRLETRGFDLDRITWTEQPAVPFTEDELAGD